MKHHKNLYWPALVLALVLILAVSVFVAACGDEEESTTTAPAESTTTAAPDTTAAPTTTAAPETSTTVAQSDLILASTTSTQDSGLFDVLIPAFNKVYPQYTVKVVAVGSGEALKLGETGDADVLLVHSPAAEKTFMEDGFGVDRKAVMYNDFIIVGPADDPAKIKGMTDASDAFTAIAGGRGPLLQPGRRFRHPHQGEDHLEGSGHRAGRRLVSDHRPGHGRDAHHRRSEGRLHAEPTGPPT